MRDTKYTVFGHMHSGTTCIAQCMINAGVDFGDNLNEKNEDMFIHESSFDVSQHKEILNCLDVVQGFKYPFLIKISDLLYENYNMKAIATIRSPLSWIQSINELLDLDYIKCEKAFERIGERWLNIYLHITSLLEKYDIPIVLFGCESTEKQIEVAMSKLGLNYSGGYDSSLVNVPYINHMCPISCIPVWEKLQDIYYRQLGTS